MVRAHSRCSSSWPFDLVDGGAERVSDVALHGVDELRQQLPVGLIHGFREEDRVEHGHLAGHDVERAVEHEGGLDEIAVHTADGFAFGLT